MTNVADSKLCLGDGKTVMATPKKIQKDSQRWTYLARWLGQD